MASSIFCHYNVIDAINKNRLFKTVNDFGNSHPKVLFPFPEFSFIFKLRVGGSVIFPLVQNRFSV